MRFCGLFVFVFLLSGAMASAAFGADERTPAYGSSGLPLPRFASLRANEVNLRTGPGTRYPIEWVFVKEGLPIEITAEYDVWRRVRDQTGTTGWVHKSTLSGRRTLIVTGGGRNLYKKPDVASPIMAHVQQDAVGRLFSCTRSWCEVSFEKIAGYMKKEEFWGVYEHETFR